MRPFVLVATIFLASCQERTSTPPDAGAIAATIADPGDKLPDSGVAMKDAGISQPLNKAANCVANFGNKLTNAFGRLDGKVIAVMLPTDVQCPKPNSDHLIIEIETQGEVYRMVVNVESDFGDPRIRQVKLQRALLGGDFQEGWHPNLPIDYVKDLNVNSQDSRWELKDITTASKAIADEIEIGADISVFATSTGGSYADSAHKIHRNGKNDDGAIVVNPRSANSRWILSSFQTQTF